MFHIKNQPFILKFTPSYEAQMVKFVEKSNLD